jgi:hypothetical protein
MHGTFLRLEVSRDVGKSNVFQLYVDHLIKIHYNIIPMISFFCCI